MKVICVGLNYAEHAAEFGDDPPTEPLLFATFENTLIEPGETIVLPPEATHTDAEAELCVELGRALADGDVVEVEVEGIGALCNPVAAERRR